MSGVITLFFWLLWGDFCLYLLQAVLPNVLPLQLKSLGASNSFTTGLLTVVPSVMGLIWNPVVATWSDRYRSRWGRRIPFLLAGTPLIVLVFLGLGWSDAIGDFLHRMAPHSLSPSVVLLGVIAVLVVGFNACNAIVYNLYFALFNDVVPREMMGRFAVLFRVVGTSAGAAFNLLVFRHAQTHLREIYVGAALLYGVAYLAMCLKVKEGEYPSLPERQSGSSGFIELIRGYFRECFSHSFYVYIFLMAAFWIVAAAMMPFLLLMNFSLGLTIQQVGWLNGSAALLSIPAFFITGFLMERVSLLKLYLWMKIGQIVAFGGLMIFLFVELPPAWCFGVNITFNVLLLSVNAVLLVVGVPIHMALYPRERFGQFSSAGLMVSGACGIAGGVLGGLFMDGMKGICRGSDYAYRYAPVWATVSSVLSAYCFYKVYRWVVDTHGHDLTTYVPPEVAPPSVPIVLEKQ